MTVGELATAKRLNLKIIFIVIYDNSLSLIRIKQEKKAVITSYSIHYTKLYDLAARLGKLAEEPLKCIVPRHPIPSKYFAQCQIVTGNFCMQKPISPAPNTDHERLNY